MVKSDKKSSEKSPIKSKAISKASTTTSQALKSIKIAYEIGDNLKVLENGQLHNCKVLKVSTVGSLRKYFIHFQGWAPKYDSWIDSDKCAHKDDVNGIMKLESEIKYQVVDKKTLQKLDKKENKSLNDIKCEIDNDKDNDDNKNLRSNSDKKIKKYIAKSKAVITDEASENKRRMGMALKDIFDLDEEDIKAHTKLDFPHVLKKQIVAEWTMISQAEENKRLLKLPRNPNVSDFLKDFLDFKNKKENIETYKTYEDMCNAFKDYFDKALPKICLYRQERSQYDMIYKQLGDDLIPSNIYGVEHLLRLFVRLPRIMSQVFVEEGLISQTNDIFQEILKFISQNKNKYFCDMQYVSIEEAMIFSNKLLSKSLEIRLSPSGRPARQNAGLNPSLDI